MGVEISLVMKGVGGKIVYVNDDERYEIAVESTGDYVTGFLVSIDDLDAQIDEASAPQKKSQVLRNLQAWSKATGNRICW